MALGLGYLVDLGGFDEAMGFQQYYDSTVNVFTDAGTLIHILLGAAAGYAGDGWSVALTAGFGGYELAKLNSGEPVTRVAGTWIEYGLGALIGALLRYYVR